MPQASELLDAARLFLTHHAEALESDDPSRAHAACTGLIRDLAATLPTAVRTAREGLPDAGTITANLLASHLDPIQREAVAHTVLRKRLAETEGALMHLQVTLARTVPAGNVEHARRLVTEARTARRAVETLQTALEEWALAADTARRGTPHAARAPTPRPVRDALRAARECLHAGVPEGAAPLLAHALRAGLASPHGAHAPAALDDALARWRGEPPGGAEAVRALHGILEKGLHDNVVAWAVLDLVERIVNQAAMMQEPA